MGFAKGVCSRHAYGAQRVAQCSIFLVACGACHDMTSTAAIRLLGVSDDRTLLATQSALVLRKRQAAQRRRQNKKNMTNHQNKRLQRSYNVARLALLPAYWANTIVALLALWICVQTQEGSEQPSLFSIASEYCMLLCARKCCN